MATLQRANYITDPRATTVPRWLGGWGGGAGTTALVTGATDGPVLPDGSKIGTYARFTWTADGTTGAVYAGTQTSTGAANALHAALPVGTILSPSIYIRSNQALTFRATFTTRTGDGTVETNYGGTTSDDVRLVPGVWTRLTRPMVALTAESDRTSVRAVGFGAKPTAGAVVEVTGGMVTGDLGPFFDGASSAGPVRADGSRLTYSWSGAANASTSTETLTDPVIRAVLVDAGTPQPVQIILNIPSGQDYTVVGTTGTGSSWPVPGGQGTGTGQQIVLMDNRSALNTPVTYQVVTGGTTYTAAPITVTGPRVVLQSLDGRTSATVRLHDNADPRDLTIRATTFDVPGRQRPPVRYATAGLGGGQIEVTTTGPHTTALRQLILDGGPLIIRTDGTTPLESAVEIIQPTKASNTLGTPALQYGDSRRWTIPYLLVDDPDPSQVLSAWTWDDFDTAMTGRTWVDFDAMFAGSTWDDFDAYDWGQLLP